MGIKITIDKNIEKLFDDYERNLIKYIEKKVKECEPIINQRILKTVDSRFHDFFNIAVENFYNGYTPSFYKTRRNTLKNIFVTKIVNGRLTFWFDPDLMSYRGESVGYEDGLYRTVFKEGWHGGAQFNGNDSLYPWRQPPIAYNGDYEDGRKKPWEDRKHSAWKPAERESISPYEHFITLKSDYERIGYAKDLKQIVTEEFQKIGLKVD